MNPYQEYQRLAEKVRDLARFATRESFFFLALTNFLKPYRGVTLWLGAHGLFVALIVLLGSRSELWAQLTAILSTLLLCQLVFLHNLAALSCDVKGYIHGFLEDQVEYEHLVAKVINRYTIQFLGIGLVLLGLFLCTFSINLVRWLVLVSTVAAVSMFLFNQLSHSIKNLNDFRWLFYSLTGRPNAIARTRSQLITDTWEHLNSLSPSLPLLTALGEISECELRHEEVRWQNSNIVLAFVAIIISLLFSEYIGSLLVIVVTAIDTLLYTFSANLSQILFLPQQAASSFTKLVYIGLWWQIINLVIGLIHYAAKSLVEGFLVSFRSVAALHEALVLITLHRHNPIDIERKVVGTPVTLGKDDLPLEMTSEIST